MSETSSRLMPADHGRRMSLEDFEFVQVQEGSLYELGRGTIVVTGIPDPWHAKMLDRIARQFELYAHSHRDFLVAFRSKILVQLLQSERHPDLAIYLTPPPSEDDTVWRIWIPEIVVEVVSQGSEVRDYKEKREEYLQFGAKEYWIFNRKKQELLLLRRSRGDWDEHVIRPSAKCQTPLLPGLEFDCAAVFNE
jgi:Uma2 family endonuclease